MTEHFAVVVQTSEIPGNPRQFLSDWLDEANRPRVDKWSRSIADAQRFTGAEARRIAARLGNGVVAEHWTADAARGLRRIS